MGTIEALIDKKNAWLSSQVDVEFPTAQSLKGRELYQARERCATYAELTAPDSAFVRDIELHRVDFHRLTILFAQLQASQWQQDAEQAAILEYFAQTILNDAHALYIAFCNQQLLFAAMITPEDDIALLSDIAVCKDTDVKMTHQQVASCLLQAIPQSCSRIWYQE